VKVKVRVNIHGIFSVSGASLVEVQKSDETEEPMETEQANDKDGEVLSVCVLGLFFLLHRALDYNVNYLLYFFETKQHVRFSFLTPLQSKMQTDQEEQPGQGDVQKEAEEKTHENEEMDARCSAFALWIVFTKRYNCPHILSLRHLQCSNSYPHVFICARHLYRNYTLFFNWIS